MTSGGELFITVGGRDLGLAAVLARVDAEMQKSADNAVRLGQSYARLASAQGQPAAASQILAGTIGQAGAASEKAIIGIETQAARLAGGGGLAQFGQAASASLRSVIGPAAALTAGIGVLNAVIGEAEAGFRLKAGLDADTKAIEIQLSGLRDTNVAFQQAAQYAAQYKLTQQQTTEAIGAAIPVIRSSKASMDTILGTFDQLRVRSPEKSFQDAARALGELQAGQYTSLNKIFNVPLADAKKLSDEIKKGGDAVQLVSAYLSSVGAGMDVVASRSTGAAGAMKDLAIAGEQLKLALGDDATGPGLLILQTRVRATQGLINLLRGDTAAMGQGLKDVAVSFAASAAGAEAYATALASGKSAAEAQAAANAAATAATNTYTQAQTSGGGGTWGLTDAISAQTTVLSAESTALAEETQKKLDSATAAEQLAQFQATLASLGGAVAGGLQTASSAAAQLAAQYNIATGAALALIQAQAALAQSKVNAAALVEQRSGERSPGGSGVAEAAAQEQARLNAIYSRLVTPEPKAKKAGGGGGGSPQLSDQTKLQNSLLASQENYQQKSEDAATQHAIDVEKINQDFYAKMRSADRDFNQSQLEGRAGFYDQLGSIESPKIAQAASAAYEAAAVEAGTIAAEKGADVAEKYMNAQEQIIGARAKRLADIEKASKSDPNKAEYLKGVDALDRKAEDAKLARIKEGEGSLAAEKQKALDDAAAKEADAQDKIGLSADRAAAKKITASERAGKAIDDEALKVDGLATKYDRLGAAGTRAGITPSAGTAAPGTSPAGTTAPPATSGDNPALAALESIRAAVDAAAAAIVGATRDTTGAVRSLKSSGGIAG